MARVTAVVKVLLSHWLILLNEACTRHFRNATSKKLQQQLIDLSKRGNTTFFTPPFHQSYLDCIEEQSLWQQNAFHFRFPREGEAN